MIKRKFWYLHSQDHGYLQQNGRGKYSWVKENDSWFRASFDTYERMKKQQDIFGGAAETNLVGMY